MKDNWLILIGLAVVVAAVGLGIWWRGVHPRGETVSALKIGALLPLSGSTATYGINAKNGIALAVEEVDAAGGVNGRSIEIVYEDTQADPQIGSVGARKLIAVDDVPVIIGPMASPVTLAVAPIAEENHVVIFSPSSSAPAITTVGDYVFRDCLSDSYEGVVLAALAFDTLGELTAAILYINNDYGKGLAQVFEEEFTRLGGKVVALESFEQDTTDFNDQLGKIKEANPETIVLIGYAEMAEILKEARELGMEQQVLSSVMFDNPGILEKAGDAAEGVLFTTWTPDPATPSVALQSFEVAYRQKYGSQPGIFAAEAYDALNILAKVIQESSYSADAIKAALYGVRDYPGASGSISFDRNGDCTKPIFVKKVENGKFVYAHL